MNTFEATNVKVGDASDLRTALVTGATGLLGQAIVRKLSEDGWKLAITARNEEALTSFAVTLDGETEIIAGDVSLEGEGARIAQKAVDKLQSIHLMIHLASPPVQPTELLDPQSDLNEQFSVNAAAFLEISSVLLPGMLRTQTGTIIAVLSQVLMPPALPGWQSYAIAKAAQAQAAAEIASSYANAGIRTIGVLPGLIEPEEGLAGAAPASKEGALGPAISAVDVAMKIVSAATDKSIPSGTAISINQSGTVLGHLAMSLHNHDVTPPQSNGPDGGVRDQRQKLALIIRRVFKLSEDAPVEDGALGVLAGWDSLGHIKLIMEIEEEFDISFDAQDSTEITSFDKLCDALGRYCIQ